MKVTVNRKDLARTLKVLKDVSKHAPTDKPLFKNVVTLSATAEGLIVMASSTTAFLSVLLTAEIEEEGICNVSYTLHDLIKAARDEDMHISFNKKLVVSGKSGFRANLSVVEGAGIPYDLIMRHMEQGTAECVDIPTAELSNLCDISKVFPEVGGFRWVEILSDYQGVAGSVQQTDMGSLDAYPFSGQGDGLDIIVRPELLLPLLTFCGERTKISLLQSNKAFVLIQDPDNTGWWGLVVQQAKPT